MSAYSAGIQKDRLDTPRRLENLTAAPFIARMACESKDRPVEDDGNGWLVDRRIGRLSIAGTVGLWIEGKVGWGLRERMACGSKDRSVED